jgi:HlyD family secretion protein
MTSAGLQRARCSLRLHLIVGLAVAVVLAAGLGCGASTQQLSGALIAPGHIAVKSLRETNYKIGELIERKVNAEDRLRRIDLRAPQDGIVAQAPRTRSAV